ncbi:hypothetical protein FNU76_10195 [Chitinimonas arctica]|uniref:Phage tail protein n=1 Tax=Chitinimonas arctica TaxID=2594795 RepID=A0A516SEX4_9NEIS|nr:phage tail tube protein [Chitinimonas arctica]QDQ26704.1 hypothetical protein FNU76_10195 [Chitinimonas arctica]
MSFANTSRATLAFVEEAIPGVTPPGGDHKALRFTGESFDPQRTKTKSDEIRDDRQTNGMTTTAIDPGGAFNLEWSYKEYDDFLRGLLQGVWVSTAAAISATFTATTLTAASGTPFAALVTGQWIRISGAATPANNGWFRILARTSSTVLTFAAATFTAEGPTAAVSVNSARLSNGVKEATFTIERQLNDVGQFFTYTGLLPAKFTLQGDSTSKLTGSFEFKGRAESSGPATGLPGIKTPSQTYPITNGVRSVQGLMEGGVAMTGVTLKSFSLVVDNAPINATAIGTLGNADISAGSIAVTVSMEAYFSTGAAGLKAKYDTDTETSFAFRVVDTAGNGYAFTFPMGQVSKFSCNAGQINQYCMASVEFTFYLDPVTGKTVLIDRAGA